MVELLELLRVEGKLVVKVFVWIMTVYLATMNRLGQKNSFFRDGIPAAIGHNIGLAEKLNKNAREWHVSLVPAVFF